MAVAEAVAETDVEAALDGDTGLRVTVADALGMPTLTLTLALHGGRTWYAVAFDT